MSGRYQPCDRCGHDVLIAADTGHVYEYSGSDPLTVTPHTDRLCEHRQRNRTLAALTDEDRDWLTQHGWKPSTSGPRDAKHAEDWLYERAEDAAAAGLTLDLALQAVRNGYSSIAADRAFAAEEAEDNALAHEFALQYEDHEPADWQTPTVRRRIDVLDAADDLDHTIAVVEWTDIREGIARVVSRPTGGGPIRWRGEWTKYLDGATVRALVELPSPDSPDTI